MESAILYQEKFNSLNLDKLENDEMRKEALDTFSSKYLLLPDAWKIRIQCEKNLSYSGKKSLIKKALSDFYSEEFFDSLDSDTKEMFVREENPFDRCLNWRYIEKILSNCTPALLGTEKLEKMLADALSFPHSKLMQMYFLYNKYSGKFLLPKHLKYFGWYKKLYDQIIADEQNLSNWCHWIMRTNDNRFIIQNFESRLAKNPFEIRLWKIYMDFLITVNKMAATDVYHHRYRRLFINDDSMNDIFWNLKVKATFSNIFYVEKIKFQRPCLKRNLENRYSKRNLNVYQKLPKDQNFSFRAPFLNYLMQNATKTHIFKLHRSCRKLFLWKNIPLCHSIVIGNNYAIKYFKDSLYVDETVIDKITNVCLEKNLFVDNCTNFEILPLITPKLKTCNLANLQLSNQNFSTVEYEILTKSKKIETIRFSSVTIIDRNGCVITLQDLLKNLPNSYLIVVPIKITITSETAAFLSVMKLSKTFGYINILISNSTLNLPTNEFIQYFRTNKKRDSVIHISFERDVDDDRKHDIQISLENALDDWKLRHQQSESLIRFILQTV